MSEVGGESVTILSLWLYKAYNVFRECVKSCIITPLDRGLYKGRQDFGSVNQEIRIIEGQI